VDSYTVRLAAEPDAAVYVTVSAARSSQEEADAGGDSVWIRSTDDPATFLRTVMVNGVAELHPIRAVVLRFDSTNWDTPQTVFVKAAEDALSEGERVVAISHSTLSADADFDALAIRNVEVTVLDDDQPDVLLLQTAGRTRVLEGDLTTVPTQGIRDTYDIVLSKVPAGTVTVTLQFDDQRLVLSSADPLGRFNPATHTVTFTAGNWNQPVTVVVAAVEDNRRQDPQISVVRHVVTSTDSAFVVPDRLLGVEVLDDDTPGVLVTESDGSTLVIAGDPAGDTYTVRLTKQPQGEVRIRLLSDGQTVLSSTDPRFQAGSGGTPPTVTFDADDWYVPIEITVVANPDFTPGSGLQAIKEFPVQSHLLGSLRGPLEIEGGVRGARSLAMAVILPGERNHPLLDIGPQPPELQQIDVLNIYDDSSRQDQTGVLTSINLSGFGMAADLEFPGDTAFGEPNVVAGGITYGILDPASGTGRTNIEILNIMLGMGNDTLTIHSTLRTEADHGGLTVVHGGGNSFLTDADGNYVDAEGSIVPASQRVIGGDTLIVTGGGGPDSPLVLYGDTTPDRRWYSGQPYEPSEAVFGDRPFPGALGETKFEFPLANPFPYDGNDKIKACGVTYADPNTPVGIIASGGPGDDFICGTEAGDHLAGSSGNDKILGKGGQDHIYGDSDFEIDVFTRVLTVLTTAPAGSDWLFGGEDNDIVFGDHGIITQTPGCGF
jgi:Ca2+-binding RTX toxin-like protein